MSITTLEGFWRFDGNNKQFTGKLHCDFEKGLFMLEIHYYDDTKIRIDAPLPNEIYSISGETVTGTQITLLHLQRTNGSKTTNFIHHIINYRAKYLINGFIFTNSKDIKFTALKFKLENLFEWSEKSLFNYEYVANGEKYLIDDSLEIQLLKGENSDINFTLSIKSYQDQSYNEKIEIIQYAGIEITTVTAQKLEYFLAKLKLIQSLISLSSGSSCKIYGIHAMCKHITRDIAGHDLPVEFDILTSIDTSNQRKIHHFDFLFTMDDLIKSGDITIWNKTYQLLEPILDLYRLNVSNSDIPINIRFLNVVQALETFHSRKICDNLNDYKKRVDSILQKAILSDSEFYKEKLFGAAQSQKSVHYVILRSRLMDLVLADFKIYFDTSSWDRFDFVDKVVDTRHYFTHYGKEKEEKIFTEKDLPAAYEMLMILLEYYLLSEVGFDDSFVESKIQEKLGRLISWRQYWQHLDKSGLQSI